MYLAIISKIRDDHYFYSQIIDHHLIKIKILASIAIFITVFDLIGAPGGYVNLFITTSANRSSSGR